MENTPKAAWTIDEWCAATHMGRFKFYQELKAGRVKAKKSGRATIVTTPPEEYIANLPDYDPSEAAQATKAATAGRAAKRAATACQAAA